YGRPHPLTMPHVARAIVAQIQDDADPAGAGGTHVDTTAVAPCQRGVADPRPLDRPAVALSARTGREVGEPDETTAGEGIAKRELSRVEPDLGVVGSRRGEYLTLDPVRLPIGHTEAEAQIVERPDGADGAQHRSI